MAVFFLFVDGVGLGDDAPENPFCRSSYPGFNAMGGGQPFVRHAEAITSQNHLFKGIDATLGVEGLPQSGTGQAALFTGVNTAREVGRHFGPFPHSKIKPFLKHESLFNKAMGMGRRCTFMNAYPDIFFERSKKRNRWSCTTLMTKSAGIRLYTEEDLKKERAITAEITQQAWRDNLKIDVPAITPAKAGQRMLDAGRDHDLILYEYYLTDKAGHAQNHSQADEVISRFDQFLQYLVKNRGLGDTLVLSSDHGNVEDLSTKTHTLNDVPLFIKGPGATAFQKVDSIQGVTPAILEILQEE
ncbi:MAG: hypothetical protein U5K69_13385 [Balneolaceae bacterium]|nr:hypothetical protein [Balneolaceae bacterium]